MLSVLVLPTGFLSGKPLGKKSWSRHVFRNGIWQENRAIFAMAKDVAWVSLKGAGIKCVY